MASRYDFKQTEERTHAFWNTHNTYQKTKELGAGKPSYYFLDGPPYTTGHIHIGHAWGRALRDALMRYKRMQGYDVWDRPGFDMHGLPIEVKVEKKLGIATKDDIVHTIGVDRFIKECESYALENMHPMIKDFCRMGVWMDFDNPYITITNEYIEGAWWALKQAHQKKLLYLGKKSMCWCPRCATALAKHELDYKNAHDTSVYVKLAVAGRPNEFLIIWTTTPWTLPFNLAVMVHPDVEYVRATLANGETWIVARELADSVIHEHAKEEYSITESFKGKDLNGTVYSPPFDDLPITMTHRKEDGTHVYTVVVSEHHVDTQSGTGLVHCAPGCGPEDFDVGRAHGLPAYNELDEHGVFSSSMGILEGKRAKKDDMFILDYLTAKKILVATTSVNHEYAHCWRCKTPVLFRATDQWFLATEHMRDAMREHNKHVTWSPDWAGSRWFDSWLSSLQDWCISRQRFWGIPLPIWTCTSCEAVRVISTQQELEKASGKTLDNLHRPWIDAVMLACTCGGTMKRTPDVLDVWLDSGVAAWATLGYPGKPERFASLGMPDAILEGKDQIRGWFNSLMCMSMVSFGKVPYRSVYMHGMINDAQGRKMSKSLGNTISPYEIIDKQGADTLRYYTIGGAQPGLDLNYNDADAAVKYRNLGVLWNLHVLLIDTLKTYEISYDDLVKHPPSCDLEEHYMFAVLHKGIHDATRAFEALRINDVPHIVEHIFLELSRTYVQMTREKLLLGAESQKQVAYTLGTVGEHVLRLMAPITPFITEDIWQRLRTPLGLRAESVHLAPWPRADPQHRNDTLMKDVMHAQDVIASTLAARERMKRSLRWPLQTLIVTTGSDEVRTSLHNVRAIIRNQTRVKEVLLKQTLEDVSYEIQPNHKALGQTFGSDTKRILDVMQSANAKEWRERMHNTHTVMIAVDGKDVTLTEDHMTFIERAPRHLESMPWKGGMVYLDTRVTRELDGEGLAREVTRRVQELRKKAQCTKRDVIDLVIQASADAQLLLKPRADMIAQRAGCSTVSLQSERPHAKQHVSEEKIKSWHIGLGFDVIEKRTK